MKTRVRKFYRVETGVWLYQVEIWQEIMWPKGFYPFKFDKSGNTVQIGATPHVEIAQRMARDFSAGKETEQMIISEFVDGVEFKPLETKP